MLKALEEADQPQLTSRQKEIYEFLKDLILNRGYGPSVREIGAHFGIRSPNGVMCHLKALEKKGLITRKSHMSRAIQLVGADSPMNRTMLRVLAKLDSKKLANTEDSVDLSEILGSTKFAVRVKDDSLKNHGIRPGDLVVLDHVDHDTVKAGDEVVGTRDGKPSVNTFVSGRDDDLVLYGKLVAVIRLP